jgi:lipooligosaccharide transport system permease protein
VIGRLGWGAIQAVVEHNLRYYRHTWQGSVASSFLSPLLILLSLGWGLGSLVDRSGTTLGVPYPAYLAPALLAVQAMETGLSEASYPLMGKLEWQKRFRAVLATPVGVDELFAGEILWLAVRLGLMVGAFFLVMVVLGLVRSPLGIAAVPVAVLTGLAFASPMFAFTCTQRTDAAFSLIFRFVMTPLFIFSGTFFPLERLPEPAQVVAWILPLAHGVALDRSLVLGAPDAGAMVHVVVLLLWTGAGLAAGRVLLRRRLVV